LPKTYDHKLLDRDPWLELLADLKVGDEFSGLVSRVTSEGVAVTIEDGVEGLIPATGVASRDLARGNIVRVVIRSIEPQARRIVLELS
jgi:ribosomal protein S1